MYEIFLFSIIHSLVQFSNSQLSKAPGLGNLQNCLQDFYSYIYIFLFLMNKNFWIQYILNIGPYHLSPATLSRSSPLPHPPHLITNHPLQFPPPRLLLLSSLTSTRMIFTSGNLKARIENWLATANNNKWLAMFSKQTG